MFIRVTTESGELVVVPAVKAIEYVKECLYCVRQFFSDNPSQKFCCKSHKETYSRKGIAHAQH